MVKYWNPRRIQRIKERKIRAEKRAAESAKTEVEQKRRYRRGNTEGNAERILDALGSGLRRRMMARLARDGAMSLSKLTDPFHITLPAALRHVTVLERAGLITTHKRGRIRICARDPAIVKEFVAWLQSSKTL